MLPIGEHLRLLLMRVDLEGNLDPVLLRRRLQHVADRRGREPVAADQHRHIRLRQHQLEPQLLRSQLRHLQLRLPRLVDQLDGHILEEILQSIRYRFHAREHAEKPAAGKHAFAADCH